MISSTLLTLFASTTVAAQNISGLDIISFGPTKDTNGITVSGIYEGDSLYTLFLTGVNAIKPDMVSSFNISETDRTIYYQPPDSVRPLLLQLNPESNLLELAPEGENTPLSAEIGYHEALFLNYSSALYAVKGIKNQTTGESSFTEDLYALTYYPMYNPPEGAVKLNVTGMTHEPSTSPF